MNNELEVFNYTKKYLRGYRPHTMFDVGANVGVFSLNFAQQYPDSRVYAFEPVAETFKTLAANVEGKNNIEINRFALGRENGSGIISNYANSPMNSIVKENMFGETCEKIKIISGDTFLSSIDLKKISYLKVDTEGFDVDVILGFSNGLRGQHIELVGVEASMNPSNTRHVPFEKVKTLLEAYGYYLFAMYEMFMDIPFSGRPLMRRANCVFISNTAIDEYARPK